MEDFQSKVSDSTREFSGLENRVALRAKLCCSSSFSTAFSKTIAHESWRIQTEEGKQMDGGIRIRRSSWQPLSLPLSLSSPLSGRPTESPSQF